MAYSDIQQTEFNRATENLIEITWTYVNLQKEFPKLSETDSMGWKQMFVVWAMSLKKTSGEPIGMSRRKHTRKPLKNLQRRRFFNG